MPTTEDGDPKQDLSNTHALLKQKFNVNRLASLENDDDAVTGTELVGAIRTLLSSIERVTKNGELTNTADELMAKMVAVLDEKFLLEGDDTVDDVERTIDKMIALVRKADKKITAKKSTPCIATVGSTAAALASNPLPQAGSKLVPRVPQRK